MEDSPQPPELPVAEALPALRDGLAREGHAVLVAPPGAGKTTRVPLALLDEPWLGDGRIVVLEPRRLAARAAAARMAFLLGEGEVGGTVGYRVRMDTRVSRRTRVEVITEGVLTRMLQSDPSLDGVGLVVFDEFHERSLQADLGLALSLQSRDLFREELRLLVMSATLDPAPVARLLGEAPVVTSEGRRHPVETRFRERPVKGWIEPAVVRAVVSAVEEGDGDVLVFLPGAGEIRRTAEGLSREDLHPSVEVFPLFGNLSRERQDRAIAPSPPGRRKVVLATSIAETSLTIDGVRVVVDSGLMRVPRFDPRSGMTRLETVRVTRDAADQRRGRAGRTAPGICYRLWTRAEDRGLIPRRRPEILEADLAGPALELAVWGTDPGELPWLDPPPDAAYAQALELLRELEAVHADGSVTGHGRRMAGMGLHPRLAHMLSRGGEMGLGRVACDLAALLGGRDLLRGEGRAPDADLRLRLEALRRARAGDGLPGAVRGVPVDGGRLSQVLREAGHWRRSLEIPADEEVAPREVEHAGLLASLAYPDRIGRKRKGSRHRFLLRNGRGAAFDEHQPLSRSEWIAVAEVESSGADARIFRAAPLDGTEIEREFGDQIEEREEVVWDGRAGRVVARRRRMLGALVLTEGPLSEPSPGAVARALLEGVRDGGLDALPWNDQARQLRRRLEFLHQVVGEPWPPSSRDELGRELESWLLPFLTGKTSPDQLSPSDLTEALLSRMGWEARPNLDRLAPTHLQVPSGSRIRVDYSDPQSPVLAVRIQEVFGWTRTPTIAGVSVTLHLLSPAHRPAQVTTDLASFWREAYFDVRKELQGRYPKHYWPEDPLTARATRGTRPGP